MPCPHHGGRESSTHGFLGAVRPTIVLLPVGYRNRHRLPHPEVVARLEAHGARILDTARDGAVTLVMDTNDGLGRPRRERVADARLWRAPP